MHRRRHGDRDGRGGLIAVRIGSSTLDGIAAHARSTAPAECCGLLLGTPTEIVESVPSVNQAADPIRRFLLDPVTHFDALRRARAHGLDVVGFYHSHPHSDPKPSSDDLAGASYPDHLYLIVKPLASGCEARTFQLANGRFIEVPLFVD